jgi:hypothetical protein
MPAAKRREQQLGVEPVGGLAACTEAVERLAVRLNPCWISTLGTIWTHRIHKVADLLSAKAKYRFCFGRFESKNDTGGPCSEGEAPERGLTFTFFYE